jgi:alkylation response protein AidB-like acyl-CoA dehydrogenase
VTATLDPTTMELREAARELAQRRFAPRAREWDEREEWPEENERVLAELGYLGFLIPEEYGGLGRSFLDAVIVLEEFAKACFTTALVCHLYLNGPSRTITVIGSEEIKRRLLPKAATGEHFVVIAVSEPDAGSAVTDLTTRADVNSDGSVVINGTKSWVTGGDRCTHALVFVRFGPEPSTEARGIGAVVVPRDAPGFSIGRIDRKMGGRGTPESELIFEDCRIGPEWILVPGDPKTTTGFKTLMTAFGAERLGNCALCLGASQAAYDASIAFMQQRHQFGRPIAEFQGLQWRIADMAIKLAAGRALLHEAAGNAGRGFPSPWDTAMAKVYINESAQEICNQAIQLHGHHGYTVEAGIERHLRDVRGMALGGGTPEILRNTIASLAFGRSFNQRRDTER